MLVVWQVFHDMLKPLLGKCLRVTSLEATEAGKPRDGHPRGSEELTRQPGPASRRAARWPRQALHEGNNHTHPRTHMHTYTQTRSAPAQGTKKSMKLSCAMLGIYVGYAFLA